MTEIEKIYRAYDFHLFKNKRKYSVLPKDWKVKVAALQSKESYPIDLKVIATLNKFKSADRYKINQFVVYCDAKQKLAFACLDNALLVMHDYDGTETVVFNDNLLRVEIELLEKNYISLDGHKTEIMQASQIKYANPISIQNFDLSKKAKEKEIIGKNVVAYNIDGKTKWFDAKYIDLVVKTFGSICTLQYKNDSKNMQMTFGNFEVFIVEVMMDSWDYE